MALTKIITDTINLSSDTTALKMPKGTTAQRPAAVDSTIGETRENTTTGKMEIYTGAKGWRALQQTGQDVGIVPSDNFNVSIWSGNSSNQTISGVGFSGDLTFLKNRTGANYWFALDTVRGPATNLNLLYPDLYNAQDTSVGSTFFQQFNSDGYSLGSSVYNNATGNNYVGYTWKGGGAATTITAGTVNSNTVDSNVSANTEAGFSIVSYTAPSSGVVRIAHGLGGVPEMVITKTYSVAGYNWYTWVKGFDTTSGYVYLDGIAGDGVSAGHNMWNNGFTSTTYEQNVGGSTIAGASTIGYLWRSIPGYSLIGSYTGTGSATDSPKIYTGFEPAWILTKPVSTTGYWYIFDNKRNTTNPRNTGLFPNDSLAEITSTGTAGYTTNFYSDGFQFNTTTICCNSAGVEYIFMCFAS